MVFNMNEILQILEPTEKVIYEGKPEFIPYIIANVYYIPIITIILVFIILYFGDIFFSDPVDIAFLLVMFLGFIFILQIIISALSYVFTHYAITNKRAILKSGIIGRDFRSIDHDRMQNVSVDVGILGVIFSVGDLNIYTGEIQSYGGRVPQIRPKYDTFVYISYPYEILKILQNEISIRKIIL